MSTLQSPPTTPASPPEHHLWRNAFLFSLGVFAMCYFYLSMTRNTLVGLHKINSTAAYTSVLLIGLSMALSGICYFFNTLDSKIIYRKHLGLIGFGYAVLHIFITLVPLSREFPYPAYFVQQQNFWPFAAAIVGTVIFVMMTLISNKYAIHVLGGIWWRRLLRLGYIAFIAIMLHFGLQGFPFWIQWFTPERRSMLPSLGLLVFVFALCVILLRILLEVAVRTKSQEKQT